MVLKDSAGIPITNNHLKQMLYISSNKGKTLMLQVTSVYLYKGGSRHWPPIYCVSGPVPSALPELSSALPELSHLVPNLEK